MSEEYTFEELQDDLDALAKIGLIEIGGIQEDGQWLYRVSEKAKGMTQDEITRLIQSTYKD